MKKSVKKIAVLLPSVEVGGAERVVQEELDFLKNDPRFYFELHLVFERGHLYKKFREIGVPVFVWNAAHKSPLMLISYVSIIRYLRRENFDILHVHLLNNFGPWVGRFAGLKVITTVHSNVQYGFFEKLSLSRSDVLFACGIQVRKNLESFIPEQKLKLLKNAVCLRSSDKNKSVDCLKRLGLSIDNKIVLSLGRLIRDKGYDLLISSFEKVVKKMPDVVLLIGGDGPERERLDRQISESGMRHQVRLLGLVDNVDDLLSGCDVYVNSSRREGLPISLLEAMSHEKPIVAVNVGGNSDVVINGVTGLLVPPECPDLLAEGLLRVLENKEMAYQLAKNAVELVKRDYSIEKHCNVLSSEYLDSLSIIS